MTLSRHFVTDQSLYKWADDAMRGQSRLKDVVLISENAEGVEVARHLLRHSQPVSAIVEASNPGIGGLHEKSSLLFSLFSTLMSAISSRINYQCSAGSNCHCLS